MNPVIYLTGVTSPDKYCSPRCPSGQPRQGGVPDGTTSGQQSRRGEAGQDKSQ
ncbi:MAG: hypothetical protein V1709_07290 [Planctomycetota bacterium]